MEPAQAYGGVSGPVLELRVDLPERADIPLTAYTGNPPWEVRAPYMTDQPMRKHGDPAANPRPRADQRPTGT